MKKIHAILALGVCLSVVPLTRADETQLQNDDEKVFYTLGIALARNLPSLDFSDREISLIQAGLADGALGREPRVPPQVWGPKIEALLRSRMATVTQHEKDAGVEYLAKAAQEPGARKTESGLVYREITPGTGATPGASDTVKIHYKGTLRDGTVFDSSIGGEPATFSLQGVVPCFGEGLGLMKVGGKSLFVCPADLAFGDQGAPPNIRPGAVISFEVELLDVSPAGADETGMEPGEDETEAGTEAAPAPTP